MKTCWNLFLVLCVIVLSASLLPAQEVTTTAGQVYSNTTLRRNGNLIMVKVPMTGGTGMVEIGIPVASIAKVKFATPPEIAKVKEAAEKGNAQAVITLTTPLITSLADFKDVPGSYWPVLAQYRLLALVSAGKDAEAVNLAREIGSLKAPGSDTLSRGGTLFAALASGDTQAVVVGAKGLPRIGGDQGSALAQYALGKALYGKKDYQGAIRAFLTIKVFYPSVALLQPAALMGAANSYIGLQDPKRALQSFNDIVTLWPDSPQAPEAKKRADVLSHS